MLAGVKWSTLFTVAGVTGLGIGGLGILMIKAMENKVTKSDFINLAMHKVKIQPKIVSMFGEPIEFGTTEFRDGWSRIGRDEIRLMVPIKGQNDTGKMYAYARHYDKKYKLAKLELSFEKIKGKRMILLDYGDQEPPDEKVPGQEFANKKMDPMSLVDVNKRNKSDQQSRRLQEAKRSIEVTKNSQSSEVN